MSQLYPTDFTAPQYREYTTLKKAKYILETLIEDKRNGN